MNSICFTCNEEIYDDKCISADGRKFHYLHFTCSQCKVLLTGPTYRRQETVIYCNKCFEEKFAPRCSGCKDIIIGKHIVVENDNHYHKGCFACIFCTLPFEDGEYYKYDGMPFCKICLVRKQNIVCNKCKELCEGDDIFANDKYWHQECFKCEKCYQTLDKIYIILDEKCYHELCILRLCAVCNKQIDQDFYDVQNENVVHPECLEEFDEHIHSSAKLQKQKEEQNLVINLNIQEEQKDVGQSSKYQLKSLDKQEVSQLDPLILNPDRQRYPYEVLKKIPPPEGVIQSKKELYLSDDEFEKLFKMKLRRYLAMTEQKRLQFKKQLGL